MSSEEQSVDTRPDRTTTDVFKQNSGDTVSVCISRVFKNINWRRIRRHMIEADLGFVERVDVVPIFREDDNGERVLAFKRAFVHFRKDSWNMESDQAREALEKLRKGESIKIVYEEPWWWNVSISMSPRPETPPRGRKKDEDVATRSKSKTKKNIPPHAHFFCFRCSKMAKAPYNLMAKSLHDPFVFFDNCDEKDRFVVFITIRKLQSEENELVKKQISRVHGEGAVHRRLDPKSSFREAQMQFLKYCIVYFQEQYYIFDMDTLEKVEATSGNALKAFRTTVIGPMDNIKGDANRALRLGFGPHRGTLSNREATVTFKTAKHGDVRIRLSTYSDPDVRNGISIGLERNLKLKTAWGACMKAIHPKFLIQQRFLRLPERLQTEEAIIERNTDDYWETVTGLTERENGFVRTSVTIPKHEKQKYMFRRR